MISQCCNFVNYNSSVALATACSATVMIIIIVY